MRRLICSLVAATCLATPAVSGPVEPTPAAQQSPQFVDSLPAQWNGTLLLYSRGYSPRPSVEAAPAPVRQALLDAGYALIASDYGAGGWSLAEAVPAQLAAIERFTALHGKPRRIIAWGESMGGLVTTQLAEQHANRIDGAVAACASIGGALGMMNMALDGAYAFRTLVAPDAGLELVRITDDRVNGGRAQEAVQQALATPEGRARVALASVLAGLPGWTDPATPQPAVGDAAGQAAQMAKAFVRGTFLPRTDQEQRAGGVFSWNTGIDYRAQLRRSGRATLVERLYREAGIDLQADLKRLNAGERVAADPDAVAYMRAHYTPNARPQVPLVAMQKIGDGMTAPALQRGYAEAAGTRAQSLWLAEAGHCGFTAPQLLAAIRQVEQRLDRGKWPAVPAGFVPHRAEPMLRPCITGGRCE